MNRAAIQSEIERLSAEIADDEVRLDGKRKRRAQCWAMLFGASAEQPAAPRARERVREVLPDTEDVEGVPEQTARIISEHGGSMSAKAFTRLVGVKSSTAWGRLQRAAKRGLIRRVSRGRFEIVRQEGSKPLTA